MVSTQTTNDQSGNYCATFVGRSVDEIVGRHLSRLRSLRREGFSVHVLAGPGKGARALLEAGIGFQAIPVGHPVNPLSMAGAFLIVQAHMIEAQPLLVHSFGHRVAWLSTLAARRVEVPAIFITLDYHWLEEDPLSLPTQFVGLPGIKEALVGGQEVLNRAIGPAHRRWMRQAYRWLGEAVDRYLVTTEFDLKMAQDLDLVEPSKLEIALGSPGVDLERFQCPQAGDPMREEAREELGLPRRWRHVIGVAGSITLRHGAQDLVATVDEVGSARPSVGWVVVLREEPGPLIRRQLDRLVRDEKIVVIEQDQGALPFRAMDVMAWFGRPSSPHDGIAEAGALAVPCVGYDTPGARELVVPGDTGYLVYEGAREELAAVLLSLLDDPARRREMGLRARSRVMSQWDRRDLDGQLLRLYDRVLEQKLEQLR